MEDHSQIRRGHLKDVTHLFRGVLLHDSKGERVRLAIGQSGQAALENLPEFFLLEEGGGVRVPPVRLYVPAPLLIEEVVG